MLKFFGELPIVLLSKRVQRENGYKKEGVSGEQSVKSRRK